MTDETKRLFSREYKLAALRRMLAGKNVSALARELGVRRKYLYQWESGFARVVRLRCAAAGGRPRPRFRRC
jgi:transposase-like protein